MSKLSDIYDRAQVIAEINWIDREITRVTELMKKRPSKIRRINDLIRQKSERQRILASL